MSWILYKRGRRRTLKKMLIFTKNQLLSVQAPKCPLLIAITLPLLTSHSSVATLLPLLENRAGSLLLPPCHASSGIAEHDRTHHGWRCMVPGFAEHDPTHGGWGRRAQGIAKHDPTHRVRERQVPEIAEQAPALGGWGRRAPGIQSRQQIRRGTLPWTFVDSMNNNWIPNSFCRDILPLYRLIRIWSRKYIIIKVRRFK